MAFALFETDLHSWRDCMTVVLRSERANGNLKGPLGPLLSTTGSFRVIIYGTGWRESGHDVEITGRSHSQTFVWRGRTGRLLRAANSRDDSAPVAAVAEVRLFMAPVDKGKESPPPFFPDDLTDVDVTVDGVGPEAESGAGVVIP